MYSDAFPAVSPYAAGKLKFLFFEGKDKQTKAIPKKTAGKASKKTEARQSTVCSMHLFVFACGERASESDQCWAKWSPPQLQ